MRRALAAVAVLVVAGQGCASIPKRASSDPATVQGDLDGVLSLMGTGGMAQACPIAADRALTASHVVVEQWFDGSETIAPYTWEALGVLGLLGSRKTTTWDLFRDLAYVQPWHSEFPRWYPIAKDPPKPGDHVRFRGWDFRKKRDAFATRKFDAKVIRVPNGHVIFEPPGVPGTSGSCVLNDAGELIAIQSFGHPLEDKSTVDGAVGVWGSLLLLGLDR